MGTPSSFEIGKAISENISGAFQDRRDKTALDEILDRARSTGDPEALFNAQRQIVQRLSPEKQQSGMQLLQQLEQQQSKQNRDRAHRERGLDPALGEGLNKEILKNQVPKPIKLSSGEMVIEKEVAKELFSAPQHHQNLSGAIEDIKGLQELSRRAYLPGIGKPGDKNQFNALRNKIAREKAKDLKGVISDKDLAFILGETGNFGAFGSVEILERVIKAIENDLSFKKNRVEQLSAQYPHLAGKGISVQTPRQSLEEAQPTQVQSGHVLMRDAQGVEYSIPNNLVEQAKSQGLQ